MYKDKKIFVYIFIILGIAFIIYLLVEKIPPVTFTRSKMLEVALRIREYVKTHQELPSDLYSLPFREGFDNRIKDAWGNEIKYSITEDNQVVLKSFGKDAKPGGQGENNDIILSFAPKSKDESFLTEIKRNENSER